MRPSLRAAADKTASTDHPFARDPRRYKPSAAVRRPEDVEQHAPKDSRKRRRPEHGSPDVADVVPSLHWRELRDLCKSAVALNLSSAADIEHFNSAAATLIAIFGIEYEDCWGEVYTRSGAPEFRPRVKIIMEVHAG